MAASRSDRLVCFDLGRVLVRICDDWQHASRAAGISQIPSAPDGPTTLRLLEAVHLSETGKMDHREFSRAVAPLLGMNFDDVLKMADAFLIEPFVGTAQLLEDLNDAGIVTACLSNTNDSHWQIMTNPERFGGLRLDRLSYRFASHLVGLRKPDAAIYKHVERETGKPGNAIIFFDDVEENVIAANQCGWSAHRILIDANPTAQIRRILAKEGILSV